MRGTPKAYEMLLNSPEKPNIDTLYFISDADSSKAKLYLGEKLIAGGEDKPKLELGNLTDISLSEDLKDKSILVYDKSSSSWIDSTLEDVISVFIGATTGSAGIAGLVPAPELGQTNLFLRSDGTWANVECEETNVWTIENEDASAMHQDIIENLTADVVLNSGDIIVIKDIITGERYQHTAYVYTGSAWAAMDGNYNAENVYFDEDFVFTENIGTVVIPASGSKTVEATGKNIKDFLASIFSQELNPTNVLPSVSFVSPSSNSSVEVGDYITPTYELEFDQGAYTYNDNTGVTVSSWSVKDSRNRQAASRVGSFAKTQMTDGMTYTIYGAANYTDGIIPCTNLGNAYPEAQIKAGKTSQATSKTWTCYRRGFYGADASMAELTSDWVRENLTSPGNGASNRTITWKAADLVGIKRFIIALPVSGGKKVKSAIITSSMNADATADYVQQATTIKIAGKNNYSSVDYNVWIYEPASIAETEVHEVTIG